MPVHLVVLPQRVHSAVHGKDPAQFVLSQCGKNGIPNLAEYPQLCLIIYITGSGSTAGLHDTGLFEFNSVPSVICDSSGSLESAIRAVKAEVPEIAEKAAEFREKQLKQMPQAARVEDAPSAEESNEHRDVIYSNFRLAGNSTQRLSIADIEAKAKAISQYRADQVATNPFVRRCYTFPANLETELFYHPIITDYRAVLTASKSGLANKVEWTYAVVTRNGHRHFTFGPDNLAPSSRQSLITTLRDLGTNFQDNSQPDFVLLTYITREVVVLGGGGKPIISDLMWYINPDETFTYDETQVYYLDEYLRYRYSIPAIEAACSWDMCPEIHIRLFEAARNSISSPKVVGMGAVIRNNSGQTFEFILSFAVDQEEGTKPYLFHVYQPGVSNTQELTKRCDTTEEAVQVLFQTTRRRFSDSVEEFLSATTREVSNATGNDVFWYYWSSDDGKNIRTTDILRAAETTQGIDMDAAILNAFFPPKEKDEMEETISEPESRFNKLARLNVAAWAAQTTVTRAYFKAVPAGDSHRMFVSEFAINGKRVNVPLVPRFDPSTKTHVLKVQPWNNVGDKFDAISVTTEATKYTHINWIPPCVHDHLAEYSTSVDNISKKTTLRVFRQAEQLLFACALRVSTDVLHLPEVVFRDNSQDNIVLKTAAHGETKLSDKRSAQSTGNGGWTTFFPISQPLYKGFDDACSFVVEAAVELNEFEAQYPKNWIQDATSYIDRDIIPFASFMRYISLILDLLMPNRLVLPDLRRAEVATSTTNQLYYLDKIKLCSNLIQPSQQFRMKAYAGPGGYLPNSASVRDDVAFQAGAASMLLWLSCPNWPDINTSKQAARQQDPAFDQKIIEKCQHLLQATVTSTESRLDVALRFRLAKLASASETDSVKTTVVEALRELQRKVDDGTSMQVE